jgi:outer membrane protein TolC
MGVVRWKAARRVAGGLAIAWLALAIAPAAHALDLAQVMRDVAQNHPGLSAARSRAAGATSMTGPAGAWPSPMLELGLANVPEGGALDMDPMTMRTVGVVQRVPLFGRKGLARRAARAEAEAMGAETGMAYFEAYGMAWRAYAEAWHAGERVTATAEHLGTMDRMVGSARARYESGTGRLEDVLRAEAERARAAADLEMFRGEARRARAMLEALRGRTAAMAGDEALEPPPAVEVPATPQPWLAAVTETHPGLAALEARARGERLSARAARRSALPDVELGFMWGFRGTLREVDPAATPPEMSIPLDDMWSARVAFMLPIFAGSDELAMGASRDAMADAAESDRRAMALDLEARVAGAHADAYASARTVRLLADTVVVTYRRALDASWSAYTAGTADLWRTLEAAHRLYEQEIALSRAREMLAMAEARFIELTGRGDLLGVPLPPAPGGLE